MHLIWGASFRKERSRVKNFWSITITLTLGSFELFDQKNFDQKSFLFLIPVSFFLSFTILPLFELPSKMSHSVLSWINDPTRSRASPRHNIIFQEAFYTFQLTWCWILLVAYTLQRCMEFPVHLAQEEIVCSASTRERRPSEKDRHIHRPSHRLWGTCIWVCTSVSLILTSETILWKLIIENHRCAIWVWSSFSLFGHRTTLVQPRSPKSYSFQK